MLDLPLFPNPLLSLSELQLFSRDVFVSFFGSTDEINAPSSTVVPVRRCVASKLFIFLRLCFAIPNMVSSENFHFLFHGAFRPRRG